MRYMNPLAALLATVVIFGLTLSLAKAEKSSSPYVDAKGNISLPKDFRTSMVHLGSWFVPSGDASGFHDV
jgi:hypothetical protein